MKIMKYLLIAAVAIGGISFWPSFFYKNTTPSQLYTTRPTEAEVRELTKLCKPTTTIPPTGVVGISDPFFTDPKVAKLAADLKLPWARAEFAWSEIEKADGTYDFTKHDAMVTTLTAAGTRILAAVAYIPPKYTDWKVIGPQYEKLMKALAERYKGKVQYWEIFNEPNLPGYGWMTTGANAKDYGLPYVSLLARASSAVHSVDPAAVIVLGGLSPQGLSPTDYLKAIYYLDGKNCMDVVAFHPYGYQNKFKDAIALIQNVLNLAGDSSKPIWLNEYGTTDEADRVGILQNAYKDSKQAKAFFWFSLKDFSQKPGKKYGLIGYDYSPKPAYTVFKSLLSQ